MSTSTQWSELPSDLLHVVCTKVVGSLHRVRFAAVCRSWRAAAIASQHAAPPALPWLIYPSYNEDDDNTKRIFCPGDGKVLPITLQSEAFGKWLVGGHDGGWVATVGPRLNFGVVNLFSGIEVALSEKKGRVVCRCHNEPCIIRKVVFSEAPASSGCIIAAITNECGIALCRVGCPEGGWTTRPFDGASLVDIMFYNGELYGLTARAEIIRFEIGVNKHGAAMVTNHPRRLSIRKVSSSLGYSRYIFELNGKLTMVRNCRSFDCSKERFFKVFELVDESTISSQYDYKWEEVTSLNDHALFVGHKWSKAVYAGAEKSGGVKINCIYADDVVYLMSLNNHGNRVYEMQHEHNGSGLPTIKSVGSYVDF